MNKTEKNAGIRVQWQEGQPSYENAKQRLQEKLKQDTLIKLHKLASERCFLLELKAKYAGKWHIFNHKKRCIHLKKIKITKKGSLYSLKRFTLYLAA